MEREGYSPIKEVIWRTSDRRTTGHTRKNRKCNPFKSPLLTQARLVIRQHSEIGETYGQSDTFPNNRQSQYS